MTNNHKLINGETEENYQTRKERYMMGLRSELLVDDRCRIHVVATDKTGKKVSLGHISMKLAAESPAMARKVISRIKFGTPLITEKRMHDKKF